MQEEILLKFKEQLYYTLDRGIFKLILLPTEKCNFRCSYCYENYEIGQMSNQTMESIKKLIWNRAKSACYSIKY